MLELKRNTVLTKEMDIIVSAQGFEYGVKHFLSVEPGSAREIVTSALNLAPERLNELFVLGAVYVNHRRELDPETACPSGTMLRVHTKARRYYVKYDWAARILFQNDDFVVLNKPAGIPSHPGVDNIYENSLTQTARALDEKLFISHRLDTTTEGIIIYGKTPAFVRAFNLQLQAKTIEKKYAALVSRETFKLPSRLIHYMDRSERAPKVVHPEFAEKRDECELVIENARDYHEYPALDAQILKIKLVTGRTHQIRAQLSAIGLPIVGDQTYGSKQVWKRNPFTENQIALKSCAIDFLYGDQVMSFRLPEDFLE